MDEEKSIIHDSCTRRNVHCSPFAAVISNNENLLHGTYAIRLVYLKLLPHLSLDVASERILRASLECLHTYINCALEKLVSETSSDTAEHIECLITGAGACDELLNYITCISDKGLQINIEDIEMVPKTLLTIFRSLLTFLVNKTHCSGDSSELQTILAALQKETVEISVKLLNTLKIIHWEKNDHSLSLLADACESVSLLASHLAKLSAVKGVLEAWKVFSALIQLNPEELGRKICFKVPVEILFCEICEEIECLEGFSIENPNDAKIFMKIIRKTGFFLKVVIRLCQLFGDYLRGCHHILLDIILVLSKYRYCHDSVIQCHIPDDYLEHVEQQVVVGMNEMVALLKKEKAFMQEVQKVSNVASALKTEEENSLEKTDSVRSRGKLNHQWRRGVPLLMLHASVISNILSESKADSDVIKLWDPLLIKNVCSILPYCHGELCQPLKLPGIMHGGHARESVTLYAYVSVHVCAFLSILDENQYRDTEEVLFDSLMSGNVWKAQFAADVLCFIARYSTAALCENHCHILMRIVESTSVHRATRLTCISLLARLLGFLNLQKAEDTLQQWISKPGTTFVALEVIRHLTFDLTAEFQYTLDEVILHEANRRIENIFQAESGNRMKEMMNYVEAINMYCSSSSVKLERVDENTQRSLSSNILKLLMRCSTTHIRCSLMLKMFCSTVRALTHFLHLFSSEDIFIIIAICSEIVRLEFYEAYLVVCDLVATLGNLRFIDTVYGERTLRKLEALIAKLLSCPVPFIHQSALTAVIAFGKLTFHEEVFPSCIDLCGKEVQENITKYLQMTPREITGEEATLSSYLLYQQRCLLSDNEQEGFTRLSTHGLNTHDGKDVISQPDVESVVKKRKIESVMTNLESDSTKYSKLRNHLSEVKTILESSECVLPYKEYECISQTLVEISNLWKVIVISK